MSSTLERRISRLEQAAGGRDDELVEYELSDEAKDLLRAALRGLWKPEEIETIVSERRLVPRSCLRPPSAGAGAHLEQALSEIIA